MSGQGSTQSYGDGTGAVPVDVIVRALEKLGPITKEALACAAVELNLAHPDACPGHSAAPAEEEEEEDQGNFDYASNSSGSPPSSPVPYIVDSDSSDGSTPSSPINIVYFEAQERHLRDSAYSDKDSATFPIAVPLQIIDSSEGRLAVPVPSLRSSILFQPLGAPKRQRSYADVLSHGEDSGEANDEEHDDAYENRGKKQRLSLRAASPPSSELFNLDSFETRYRDHLLSEARRRANSGATTGHDGVNESNSSEDENTDDSDARSAYTSAKEYDSGDEFAEEVEGGRSPDFTLKTLVEWDDVDSGDESEEEVEEDPNPFALKTLVKWDEVAEEASNAQAEYNEDEEAADETEEVAPSYDTVAEEASNAQVEYNDDEEAADEAEEAAPEVARVPQNPRFAIRNLLN
ncbi:hypothetical protein DFP72DRAFT_364610 [Ephemerocybe angulata]|uniref:Uncharacterized protein n=1 Tax=Ephemerocybe angulata TaxID=980116 RepID=A0A8H6HZV5_9AGAR|nr:hypothetical protein DFP72DRAFT_364610 [Tulosesus angulatus]